MTATDALEKLSRIAVCLIDELHRVEQSHSCILAAIVATEVLHTVGYGQAYPLTVRPRILNPLTRKWLKETGRPLNTVTDAEWNRLGGPPIFLGKAGLPGEDWVGHVVVIVPNIFEDRHAMLDLTIPQVNLPGTGNNFVPLSLLVSDAFVRGECEHQQGVNGALIAYKAFPGDQGFESTEIWAERPRYKWFVDEILAKIGKANG
jgi:hypothetical protein